MKTQRRPPPYQYDDAIASVYDVSGTQICSLNTKIKSCAANGKFIVKACNSHCELLEALKDLNVLYGHKEKWIAGIIAKAEGQS